MKPLGMICGWLASIAAIGFGLYVTAVTIELLVGDADAEVAVLFLAAFGYFVFAVAVNPLAWNWQPFATVPRRLTIAGIAFVSASAVIFLFLQSLADALVAYSRT